MYQIKSVGPNNIIRGGHEIAVIGGRLERCEIRDQDGRTTHAGTYASCIEWLRDRRLID